MANDPTKLRNAIEMLKDCEERAIRGEVWKGEVMQAIVVLKSIITPDPAEKIEAGMEKLRENRETALSP